MNMHGYGMISTLTLATFTLAIVSMYMCMYVSLLFYIVVAYIFTGVYIISVDICVR